MEMIEATVRRAWDETPRLKGVVLEVPPETVQAYRRPGQFIEARFGQAEPAPFAIASSPGEARAFELLVGEPVRSQMDWSEGRGVLVRGPLGFGFPVERAKGQDVLLFAQGSALAALRPVVEMIRRRRKDYRSVRLYVGAHTEADRPYVSDYPAWRAEGIEVLESISRPWVQERFRSAPGCLHDTVAFVCGMEKMMDDVTAELVTAGVSVDRIGRNV